MTLYKVIYEGIFEGDSEKQAELYASRFRDELQHKKTVKLTTEGEEVDFDFSDHLDQFFELFVNKESEKFKNIDPKDAHLLLKDFDKGIKIFLTNLKESTLIGLVKLTPKSIDDPDSIAVVELSKDLIPLYMGEWIKQAEMKKEK